MGVRRALGAATPDSGEIEPGEGNVDPGDGRLSGRQRDTVTLVWGPKPQPPARRAAGAGHFPSPAGFRGPRGSGLGALREPAVCHHLLQLLRSPSSTWPERPASQCGDSQDGPGQLARCSRALGARSRILRRSGAIGQVGLKFCSKSP